MSEEKMDVEVTEVAEEAKSAVEETVENAEVSEEKAEETKEQEAEQENSTAEEPIKRKWSTGKIVVLVLGIVILLTALVLAGLTLFYPIKPLQDSYTYELGTPVDENPELYLDCFALSEYFCTLNFAEVDQSKPGTYIANIEHPVQTVPFTVIIEDTIPPELTLTTEDVVLEVSKGYSIDKFFVDASDISGEVEITMFTSGRSAELDSMEFALENAKVTEEVSFDNMGEYYVYVSAADPSGNVTTKSVLILADTPPTITPYRDFYLAIGSEVDYGVNVKARDELDGNLTKNISIDTSDIKMDVAGEYEVIYSVTDSNGLVGSCSAPVYVMDPLELQELINTHQIDRKNQTIAGAPNIYDGGYFTEDNIKFVLEYYTPAIVHIEQGNSQGSGFIIDITDTDVIICTNYHVLKNDSEHMLTFYNGIVAPGTLIGRGNAIDVAFTKVSIEDLKFRMEYIMDDLMTVHIDQEYVNGITDPSSLSAGHRTMYLNGGDEKDRTGRMIQVEYPIEEWPRKEYPRYYKNVKEVCVYTATNYGGCSGSAVFDGYGNLVGMASYHRYQANELGHKNFGMTVDTILSVYEELTGEKLNYK